MSRFRPFRRPEDGGTPGFAPGVPSPSRSFLSAPGVLRAAPRTQLAVASGLVVAAFAVGASLQTGAVAGTTKPAPPPAPSTCTIGQGFGRMFPNLKPATWSLSAVQSLADSTMEISHNDGFANDGVANPDFGPGNTSNKINDQAMNIEAGYTYSGQFIDHDITLDNTPRTLDAPVSIATLKNARTPYLDLDSVYANGPTGSPAMYEADHVHLKLGAPLMGSGRDPNAHDLLRDASGQAMIGDPRNDENKIVASLHELFVRFHNKMADHLAKLNPTWDAATLFAKTRQQVTWYYQWAVVKDFLPTIVGTKMQESVIHRSTTGHWDVKLKYYNPCTMQMPIEFSGAAYRFGHSMVRDDYQINAFFESIPIFNNSLDPRSNLGGFQPTAPDFGFDWHYFFTMDPDDSATVQHAYKIDNSLVPGLREIPGPAAGGETTVLASRNLLRGEQYNLPSGEDVAKAMGLKPLRPDQIMIGSALGPGAETGQDTSADKIDPSFKNKTPLWTYILAEAANQTYPISKGQITGPAKGPNILGPVGGRIVSEVFVGMLKADPRSIVNNPAFVPDKAWSSYDGSFGFRNVVEIATGERPLD